ncbi:MAG: GtrA family protein [Chloroflexi bacterium]|nr:MAG: GtrA family protein [Chloroflexota bacterium]MBL1193520.1 GtrA family protein [Chloroflexota bacterium]NOH10811.1 GtrA family protein [Chloroflexota bacterium]
MILVKSQRERTRFLRFATVGAIGAVIDFIVFNILLSLGLIVKLAGALSFVAAVSSNFTWNRLWTYPDSRSKSARRQMVQFLIVSVLGLSIRLVMLAITVEPFTNLFENFGGALPISPETLGPNLALGLAIAMVMVWNFFVNRYWTYNDVE